MGQIGWEVLPQLIDLLVFFAQTSLLTTNFSDKIEKKGKNEQKH